MKRILNSSSGSNSNSSSNNKRSKITFDIQLDQRKYYFRGDVVEGRIYLESPKPIKVKNIRVQWFGRVRVQLEPSLRDERELFRETAYLDLPETENATETARREALKKAATTTTAYGIMIPPSPSKGSHYVEVDKLYTYPFSLVIPQNTILPSCTESETSVGGIVEYIIEACLERPTSDFAASIKTQILVPVLQRIETTRPEQVVPQSVQVESQGPFSQCRGEGTATLTASVPKEAFVRNLPVPVTIEIKHFEPFQRKQGLMIALIRTCRIVCKGASYILPDSVIHNVKADIDLSHENGLSQSIVRSILIPQSISPTVGVNGRLFEISYKIRARAQVQDDNSIGAEYNMSMVNFPADFQILSYLTAEIPIDIGTLPIPENHIPPIPLKPQFASFLDTYSASNSTTPAASNNSEEATAEKTHMLKKMQRMLRRSSGPVPKKGESTDQPGEQLPMNKNELLALFADNASLKGRSSLNSSSDDSAISRASIRGGGGVHSSMSTTDSVGSEILTQLQKGLPPPPPSLPPPKQPNTDAFATLPSSFRLSLGPEFSAAVLSSELAKQRQQRHEKSPTPSASSSTSLEHYKSTPKASVADNLHFHHLHRRRINSDSIVLDKPSSSMKDHISNNDLQKQQRPHPLTSSNSAAAVGGVHYFYPFDDSSSDEEVEEQQQQSNNSNRSAAVALQQRRRRKSSRRCRATTTAAGYEKPNSVSNNLDASEAQVERLEVHYNKNSDTASTSSPSRPSYPVTHVDKPDELTASDTDASSNEEDLLDILSRRDRRIASRMTTHQQQ